MAGASSLGARLSVRARGGEWSFEDVWAAPQAKAHAVP